MRVIRVFPRRTSFTPDDAMAFVGDPPLGIWRPEADEVHVSCVFTWDVQEARRLAEAWGAYYPVVRIGGPAMDSRANGFEPGKYIRSGVTFTTRGCNNHCPWCLVPPREGRLVEIHDFAPGYIIQDNNLLQASRPHIERVMAMLKTQRAASFSGGLQASLVSDWFVEELRGLKVKDVFLAADTVAALGPLEAALAKLHDLPRYKRRVYTMIGYGLETITDATERLESVWELGGMPFAQLYQPPDQYIEYSREWKALVRKWSRPAVMAAAHKSLQSTQIPKEEAL